MCWGRNGRDNILLEMPEKLPLLPPYVGFVVNIMPVVLFPVTERLPDSLGCKVTLFLILFRLHMQSSVIVFESSAD